MQSESEFRAHEERHNDEHHEQHQHGGERELSSGSLVGQPSDLMQPASPFWYAVGYRAIGRLRPAEAAKIAFMNWGLIWAIVASLVAAWLLFLAVLWVFRPHDVQLAQLVRIVPDVLRLVRQLVGDRSVPLGVRAALIGLLAWLLNPIDLIPEFIPVLGPLDDVVVAVLVLRYVRRRIGDDELRRRWPGTPDGYALLGGVLGRR